MGYMTVGRAQELGLGFDLFGSDPLAKYEPGKKPPEIYAKYAAYVAELEGEASRLAWGPARTQALAKVQPLKRQRDDLAGAFAPGSQYGERDVKKLGTFVAESKAAEKVIRTAKKTFGQAAAAPRFQDSSGAPVGTPPAPAASTPEKRGGLWPWLIAAAAALFVLGRK